MIKVTRINGEVIVVNAEFIEFIEPTPDTIVTLTTGKKMMVQETVDEVIGKVADYRRRVGCALHPATRAQGAELANDGD